VPQQVGFIDDEDLAVVQLGGQVRGLDQRVADDVHWDGGLFAVANFFVGVEGREFFVDHVQVGVAVRARVRVVRLGRPEHPARRAAAARRASPGQVGLGGVAQQQAGEGPGGGELADALGAKKQLRVVHPPRGHLGPQLLDRPRLAEDLVHTGHRSGRPPPGRVARGVNSFP